MTYYTVHFSNDGQLSVFQSIVRDNREDLLLKLDTDRAVIVKEMIEHLLKQARPNAAEHDGFTVFQLLAPAQETDSGK